MKSDLYTKTLLTIGVALLVASALPANAQWGLDGPRMRKKPPSQTAPNAQSAPAPSGVNDVKWDGNTIRSGPHGPMLIYPGTDPVKPATHPIAVISLNHVILMPGVDLDVSKLQSRLTTIWLCRIAAAAHRFHNPRKLCRMAPLVATDRPIPKQAVALIR